MPCRAITHAVLPPSHALTVPCPSRKSALLTEKSELLVHQFNGFSCEFLTAVNMDRCAEHTIIASRLCFLSEQGRHVIISCRRYLILEEGELVRRKHWTHNVFWATEDEGEFGRLKGNRQKFCTYFRMGISKYENFKEVLSKYNRKKNTPRRSITTEEKLAL